MENQTKSNTIKVKADINSVPFVNELVEAFLKELGISMKIQMQVNVVIDEILSNIAQYSFGEAIGMATIIYEFNEEERLLTITFIDDGIQYNPLNTTIPDITLSAEDREIGGLGIFMVKKFMDELSYEYKDGCNHFTLKKTV